MGVGFSVLQRCPNRLDHRIGLRHHLMIPKAQHAKPGLSQMRVTALIASRFKVLAAIHFKHEPPLQAHEIQHVIYERVLAAELATFELSSTQVPPQRRLGVGHALAQLALELSGED
jgi:hypothetical protein